MKVTRFPLYEKSLNTDPKRQSVDLTFRVLGWNGAVEQCWPWDAAKTQPDKISVQGPLYTMMTIVNAPYSCNC